MKTWRLILPLVLVAAVHGPLVARQTEIPPSKLAIELDDVQRQDRDARIVTAADMERERGRIAAHLARIEAKLRAADVGALSPGQKSARARHLDVLREYRIRRVFPHNHVLHDQRTPVFVDEHGTQCAVGYLIAESGREDLTQRIASTRNRATVAELADDPELRRWLDAAGLSPVEAGMIQPSYGGSGYLSDSTDESNAYATWTIIATGVNGGMVGWNLLASRSDSGRLPGVLGVTSGLAQAVMGGFGILIDEPGHDLETAHIVTNIGLGTLTSVLAAMTLRREARDKQESHDGVRPVGNIVERLLIADRPEARRQDAQFLRGQRASGVALGRRFRPAEIGFGLSCSGEPGDRLVVPDGLGELLHELVDPLASLGGERGDGSRQVLGVVVGCRHDPRSS
jgi:hypothetical protein